LPEPVQPAPPSPVIEEDDADLFLQAMGSVRQLDGSRQKPKSAAPARKPERTPAAPPRREMVDQAEIEAFSHAIGQLKLDVAFADKFPEDDELKPLGANRLRQLKKGIIRLDRQLDLHGLTREEALEALPRFLRNARAHGEKAALVITGKGNNSPAEPVLQQAVAAWLREAGKELVAEFDSAPREMGGSGAFVVFLKG
jgi:DNA-nicking Smr family endonuclease